MARSEIHFSANETQNGGDDAFDALHVNMLRYFSDLVDELGGQSEELLRQIGILESQLDGHTPDLRYRQTIELLELAAATLRCPDFGMRLAIRQGGSRIFGPLGPVMRNSATFGEALVYVVTHNFAHSLAGRTWLRSCRPEKAVFSGHDILLEGVPKRSQAVEQIMLLGSLGAMEMTGGYVRARKVFFRHQPVSSPGQYRRYFRCEVLFGQNEDGVIYSEQDMACPVLNPDPTTYRKATSFIETGFTRHAPPLAMQIRALVIQHLRSAYCTNIGIAEKFGLHPRVLHRRLAAEGTSFQKIKDGVRRDAILHYIQNTTLEFSQISEMVGFAESSELSRFCAKWLGASPTKLRLLMCSF